MFSTKKKNGIPLNHIKLSQERRIVVVEVQIVVAKVDESGELTYNKHHNIEDEVQELMAKWLKKTRRNDCVQSRKGDEKKTREIDYESSKRMDHQLRVDKKSKHPSEARTLEDNTSNKMEKTH